MSNEVEQVNNNVKEASPENNNMMNGGMEDAHRQMNGLSISDEGYDQAKGGDNDAQDDEHGPNGKGNEEKKIFCGGISYDTSNTDLVEYFGQFGPVKEAQVKYDRVTGRSRGFAFVEFETVEGCKASLGQREQTIKGKQCEIKPAKTREVSYMNKKVFVGGLPGDFPEEELRKHFEQFGRVEDIEWPFDKQNKQRKNFAFVVFEDENGADHAAANPKQQFANRECDVKKAVPQSKRTMFQRGGGMGMRGGFNNGQMGGGMGVRGAAPHQMQLYPNAAVAAQWYAAQQAAWYNNYNGGAWYQNPAAASAGVATGANATAVAPWYNSPGNNAAAAAQASQWYGNWYNQHHQQNNGGGGVMGGGGVQNSMAEANGTA